MRIVFSLFACGRFSVSSRGVHTGHSVYFAKRRASVRVYIVSYCARILAPLMVHSARTGTRDATADAQVLVFNIDALVLM